jgi:hypothetical protein
VLIDKYQSEFQFNKLHTTQIAAEPMDIYPVIKSIDFFRSKIIRLLFTLRGLPKVMCSIDGFIEIGFVLLEEKEDEEIVIALIFHPLRFRPVPVTPDEYIDFNEKGYVKAIMNFHISRMDETVSLLSTESRVFCTSRKAMLMFVPYWMLISRFSGLIRIMMLRLIKQEAEKLSRERRFR